MKILTLPSHTATTSFPITVSLYSRSVPLVTHKILSLPSKRELSKSTLKYRTLALSCRVNSSLLAKAEEEEADVEVDVVGDGEFVVVNFYHLVLIEDPLFEVDRHSSFMEGFTVITTSNYAQLKAVDLFLLIMPKKTDIELTMIELDIHGRIYFNKQGINAQFSGSLRDSLTYVEWVREDHRFTNILVNISPSPNGHAFPRLKLRYKPSLVQFDIEAQNLPLLEQSMRATPLTPVEWKKRFNLLQYNDDAANKDLNKTCILLDVRNGYEWDIGHFHGAQRPEVDCFRSTSFGLSNVEVVKSDPLVNVDRDTVDILMYCTGGIRCDVYSTILRQKGFKNLYTLKGGVSHYLEKEGPEKWVGNLFVFDSRLSLPPSTFKPHIDISSNVQDTGHSLYARCYTCTSQVHELRHRNCANLDCNLLFLCCRNCVEDLGGCCCAECRAAPRLRPILVGHERYKKWHIYRDGILEQTSPSLE